ncbi:hypothetical protein [Mucilaginibacter sp. SMC90]|nr:hypothetical protein [Mucilaginibacter sp. SMC90]
MGESTDQFLYEFAGLAGEDTEKSPGIVLQNGEVLVWEKKTGKTT